MMFGQEFLSDPSLWICAKRRFRNSLVERKLKLILLMAEILHQLIGSLSHDLQGLYIPGGAGFLPSTVRLSTNTTSNGKNLC